MTAERPGTAVGRRSAAEHAPRGHLRFHPRSTDLVLRGGRVVDPGSGLDAVCDVWIREDRIVAVGRYMTTGQVVMDVSGMIVGPGFVDLHSHAQTLSAHRLQAFDGVTTVLDLEAGRIPVDLAYTRAAAVGRPLNYGFSASWAGARAAALLGTPPDASVRTTLALFGNPRWQRTSTHAELTSWLGLLEHEIGDGGLGIGVLQGYAPYTDPEEFVATARLAATAGVPVFSHARELVEVDPAIPVDGPGEIARVADQTGAQLHHCHVSSTARRHIDRVLATIEAGQMAGSSITVESHPYGAGSTAIGAAFLHPDRLSARGVGPRNIVVVATGERVTDATRLNELRQLDPGAVCIVEYLDESSSADVALLQRALAYPDSVVASDAMPILWPDGSADSDAWPLPPNGRTHPRLAGSFAKSLRQMVRENACWSWIEAFRRCSYLPSRVLDPVAVAMRGKGRLDAGADADIVVIDPSRISDAATYADPVRPSVGIRHLLVAGTFVIRDGQLMPDSRPGRPIRGRTT